MYIKIHRRLFTDDPAIRFARTFNCKPTIWREVWRRYKVLDYTRDEAREYLALALGINTKLAKDKYFMQRFNLWINRTEVYNRAQIALRKGAHEVVIDYFQPYNKFVIKELTRNK